MRRLARRSGMALAALLVAGLAALIASTLGPHRSTPKLRAPADGISLATQTLTRTAFFGDRVTVTALVVADTKRIDPQSLRASADFRPFKVVATSRQERRSGSILTARTAWTLLCLDPACLPGTAQHAFSWAPVQVAYRLRGTSLQRALTAPFEPVTILTRVARGAAAHPRFRVPPPVVESPRYRIEPRTLASLLVAGGGLLCVAVLGLAASALVRTRRRNAPAPDAFALVLSELQLAARGNGDSGRRRRALERLAELVEPLDAPLSHETRTLAWAPDDPPHGAIAELSRRAREAASE